MADINQITNASSYVGNAALGGGREIGITISTTPIQQLGAYFFYRDRERVAQKRKEDVEAANRIAMISGFDVNSPLTPYRDDLQRQLTDIQGFIRQDPSVLNFSRNKDGYVKLQEKLNQFENTRRSATSSDAIYNARKAGIDKEPDPAIRDIMQRRLDMDVKKHFENGIPAVLGTPLKSAPEVKPEDYEIPTAATTTFDMLSQLPNSNIINEFSVADLNKLKADSILLAQKVRQPNLDENAAYFKNLSPEEQQYEREKAAIVGKSSKQIMSMASEFNKILQEFRQANPDANINNLTGDVTGKDMFTDIIKLTNNVNKQIRGVNQLIKAGQAKDASGKIITTQYDTFNLEDGLDESELIMLHSLQKSGKGIMQSLQKTVQETDDEIQRSGQYITDRHNRAMEGLRRADLDLEKDKWKTSMTGGETTKNGAMIRAQRIYNDMRKLADKYGVISPDKIRQLNTEQLKYLGTETVGETAGGEPNKLVYKPLDLSGGKYALQLVNGEIRVLEDAKPLKDGRYEGKWDRTKSTNIFNTATNILNEELSKAGAKELNTYMPIETATMGTSTSTSGGSQTQSGSQTQRSSTSNAQTQPYYQTETYTRSELKQAGWTDAQINQAVKDGKIKLK